MNWRILWLKIHSVAKHASGALGSSGEVHPSNENRVKQATSTREVAETWTVGYTGCRDRLTPSLSQSKVERESRGKEDATNWSSLLLSLSFLSPPPLHPHANSVVPKQAESRSWLVCLQMRKRSDNSIVGVLVNNKFGYLDVQVCCVKLLVSKFWRWKQYVNAHEFAHNFKSLSSILKQFYTLQRVSKNVNNND